jgi:hypothetical protein
MLRRAIAGLTGLLLTAVLAQGASAATLTGDYQFQGTRASSGPGNLLVDAGGANSFQTDSVFGATRQVLAFPLHHGVALSPTELGGPSAPDSVVTTFKLALVTGLYRRILDPSSGQTPPDQGFYVLSGKADIYGANEAESSAAFFEPDHYETVAITSAPPTQTKVFVNGALAVQAPETIALRDDTLRFFKDNDFGANNLEDSAGAVSCIRVYSGVLTDAEVAAIGASPTCTAPPAAVVKKKCRKKKKHHHASAAKKHHKKKCKKKRKK